GSGVDAAEHAAQAEHAAPAAAPSSMALSTAAPSSSVPNEALAPYQAELLDLAFETVSKMPAVPHIKNRTRAQEEIVEAALALGQPKRARAFSDRIENWR